MRFADGFSLLKLAEMDPRDLSTLARSRNPLERLAVAQQASDRDTIRVMQDK